MLSKLLQIVGNLRVRTGRPDGGGAGEGEGSGGVKICSSCISGSNSF